jgi:hemerythrin-like metal-binding protein
MTFGMKNYERGQKDIHMSLDLLCDVFVRYKIVTNEQLIEAIKTQEANKKNLGEILIDLGYITKEQLLDCARIQEYEYNKQIDYAIYKGSRIQIDMSFYELNKEELTAKTKNNWDHIKLSTGIPIIDIQHIWLVMLSHYGTKIYMTTDTKTRIKEAKNIFGLLLEYAQEHMTVEESLLNFMKYNPDHLKQHKDFFKHFSNEHKELIDSTNEGITSTILINTCKYLKTWILSHIAIYDINYSIELLKSSNRKEIIQNWIEYLKKGKLITITRIQSDLYNTIIKE